MRGWPAVAGEVPRMNAVRKLAPWIVSVLLSGCPSPFVAPQGPVVSTGSLGLSSDGATLYVSDADNGLLRAVAATDGAPLWSVPTAQGAARVVMLSDGRVAVVHEAARALFVVDPSTRAVQGALSLDDEPATAALAADGKTLWLALRGTQRLVPVDLSGASPAAGEAVALPGRPSGLALSGTEALVTLDRPAVAVRVSLTAASYGQLISPAPLSLDATPEKVVARRPLDPVALADGAGWLVAHELVSVNVDGMGGDAETRESSGPVLPLGTVRAAMAVVRADGATGLTRAETPEAWPEEPCWNALPMPSQLSPSVARGLPSLLGLGCAGAVRPSAALLDPTGDWLWVAGRFANNVTLVGLGDHASQSFSVPVAAGPDGLALHPASQTAYVHSPLDHTVVVLVAGPQGVAAQRRIVVGASPLTDAQQLGRRLFHDASAPELTQLWGAPVACATCHEAGRTEGDRWPSERGLVDTPALAGRPLRQTAPYLWDGSRADATALLTHEIQRMGGWADPLSFAYQGAPLAQAADAVFDWLATLPPPQLPAADARPIDTAARERGRLLFEGKANCASCHPAPLFTDNKSHDVGTGAGRSEAFDTPPLHQLRATAPYLHDGRAPMLATLLALNAGGTHGTTASLTDEETVDLISYLESL